MFPIPGHAVQAPGGSHMRRGSSAEPADSAISARQKPGTLPSTPIEMYLLSVDLL